MNSTRMRPSLPVVNLAGYVKADICQAAGGHEVWFNPRTNRYTTVPIIPGICPKERFGHIASDRVRITIENLRQAVSRNAGIAGHGPNATYFLQRE
jgi:hypothetical protein